MPRAWRGRWAQRDDTAGQAVRRQQALLRQQLFGGGEPVLVAVAGIAVAAADLGDQTLLELLPAEAADIGQAHHRGEDAGLPGRVEARGGPGVRQARLQWHRHRASR